MFQKAVSTQDVTNPVSLLFFLLYVRYSSPPSLCVILRHFSHDCSNWSSPAPNSISLNYPSVSLWTSRLSPFSSPWTVSTFKMWVYSLALEGVCAVCMMWVVLWRCSMLNIIRSYDSMNCVLRCAYCSELSWESAGAVPVSSRIVLCTALIFSINISDMFNVPHWTHIVTVLLSMSEEVQLVLRHAVSTLNYYKKVRYFPIKCSPISERALLLERF
jgi:hypothetical protein